MARPNRYDYIHIAAELAPLLTSSAYLHEPRHARLSDHAAVSIDLDLATEHLPRAGRITPAYADALF